MSLLKNIEENINTFAENFELIPYERKELLKEFASYITEKLKTGNEINLTFICTHNSRRSHMSQIWAQTAAEYYGIKNIFCYSGGTEATAFNPRAIVALEKTGFEITRKDDSDNPVYLVEYSVDKPALECFSKIYSDPFNPQNNFAAIMTCSDAETNCPVVFGAEKRFPIRYEDPKDYDGTKLESRKYYERLEQIGREMLYVFSLI